MKNRFVGAIIIGLAELSAWAATAGLFLYFYVHYYSANPDSVVSHYELLAFLLCGLCAVRLMIWRLLKGNRLALWLLATINVTVGSVLLAYYLLVVAGLASWGRVVSWPLIRTYSGQAGDLLAALGYSPALILLAAIATFFVMVSATACWVQESDWLKQVSLRTSSVAVFFICSGLALISAVGFFRFVGYPQVAAGEPFALTFFPEQGVRKLQNNSSMNDPLRIRNEARLKDRYSANPGARRKNVVLIIGDALRSDHMSLYGYGRQTTPNLDELRRQGRARMAESMRSVCVESFCGISGILSSKFVHEFVSGALTLYDVLRMHGYRIHLILGGDHANFYGLRETYGGVDSYFDGSNSSVYMNDDQLVVDRISELPQWDGEPQFIQIHLMSTHGLGKRHPDSMVFQPSSSYYRKGLIPGVEPELSDQVVNYYDNGVVQFDSIVAEILRHLNAKGYLNDALVALTGDHGELLGEHGEYAHATVVYEEAMRVPFVLLNFGYAYVSDLKPAAAASQVDIAPSILYELEMPIPSSWSGSPLQSPLARRLSHFQQSTQVGVVRAMESGALFKYWIDLRSNAEFLYAVDTDPGEEFNLIDKVDPQLRGQLRQDTLVAGSSVVIRGE